MPRRVEWNRLVGAVLADPPAAQQRREGRHVGLRVAARAGARGASAGGAQRVKFKHFACEVLVDAGDARRFVPARGAARLERDDARVRPGRLRVVEVAQHRRVRRRGEEQRLEAAGDVRPDGVALERADQAARAALQQRDREVVGPEHLQSLGERARRGGCGGQARTRVGSDDLAVVAGEELLGGHAGRRIPRLAAQLALGGDMRERALGVEKPRAARRIGRADLRREPARRIATDDREIGFAETEPMRRDRGLQRGRQDHACSDRRHCPRASSSRRVRRVKKCSA